VSDDFDFTEEQINSDDDSIFVDCFGNDLCEIDEELMCLKTLREARRANKKVEKTSRKSEKLDGTTRLADHYQLEKQSVKQKTKIHKDKRSVFKNHFLEFVRLSLSEYEKLCNRFTEKNVKNMIEILNNYKGSSGKKYKSDYHAILSWVVKEHDKRYGTNNYKRSK
jgi:hypothetical protein